MDGDEQYSPYLCSFLGITLYGVCLNPRKLLGPLSADLNRAWAAWIRNQKPLSLHTFDVPVDRG